MKLSPDEPYKLKDLISYLSMFVGTGIGLAIAQNDSWYFGAFGGFMAGCLLCLPVFIIVNLIHKNRRTNSG